VFHFLTDMESRAAYLDRLRAAVRPGGYAMLATFAPDGPEKCSGLTVARYAPEELAAALGETFALVGSAREDHATPWGAVQRFSYALCRKGDGRP